MLVIGFDLVQRRHPVAPEWIAGEVRIGQSQVALIRNLVGELQLEVEPVAGVARRKTRFQSVVGYQETALAAAIHRLVSVGHPLVGFGQESETRVRRTAVGRVQPPRAVLAAFRNDRSCHFRGDGRRYEVERATDGIRSLGDGRGTFQDLEGMHAPGRREVIRRWRGVGRRGNQHIVLKQRDAAAALARHAPDADVGPQAESVLDLYRDTGYLPRHALDIGIGESCDVLGSDDMGRTGHVPDIVAATDDGDFFEEWSRFFLREDIGSCHRDKGCERAHANAGQPDPVGEVLSPHGPLRWEMRRVR